MGAILTGRYPSSLPLCGPITSSTDSGTQPWCMHIPNDAISLPEVLDLYDYQTLLITDGIPGASILGREFDDWQNFGQPSANHRPFHNEVRNTATEWWNQTEGPRLNA